MAQDLELEILPLSFTIQGRTLHNYPDNRDMQPEEFYRLVRAGEMPTTSAVNLQQYIEALTPVLKAGMDVLILSFSSGLSATWQASAMAAEELRKTFPERKILVVDTLCASMGQGLLCWYACQKRKEGQTMEAVRDWCEENKRKVCHWFTVDDLMHLKRGGRVSATTALVGTMLQIKPVLHVDDAGHLINVAKARGRRASLDALVAKVGELGTAPEKQPLMLISYTACREDAQYVADQIQEQYKAPRIELNSIGPVVGSHTGVGCVALFFMGARR